MDFSPNGQNILLRTVGTEMKCVNSFDGKAERKYWGIPNPKKEIFGATYSPDSAYVMAGTADGFVRAWDCKTGVQVFFSWNGIL